MGNAAWVDDEFSGTRTYPRSGAARDELLAGERVIREGKPRPGWLFVLAPPAAAVALISWVCLVESRGGAAFVAFPALLVGLGMMALPAWSLWRGPGTTYLITDRRAIVLQPLLIPGVAIRNHPPRRADPDRPQPARRRLGRPDLRRPVPPPHARRADRPAGLPRHPRRPAGRVAPARSPAPPPVGLVRGGAARPVAVVALALLASAATGRGDDGEAVARALGYLAREVPAWSRAHRCFSCHNNGDAARALYEGVRLGRPVAATATADTDAWLSRPGRWDDNGGDGPFSDKVLARVAFAAGLAGAVTAGRAEDGRAALVAAGRRLVGDQADDGGWRVDAADPVGSPATYGRPLATWLAVGTLRAADPVEFRPPIARGHAWLRRVEPTNAPGAAVVLLAAGDDPDFPAPRVEAALAWFAAAQAPDGGWGPYRTAPPEVFDTALGVLALSRHPGRPGVADRIRRGRSHLLAAQDPAGSWPETTRPSGGESYAQRLSTTGWAALALLAPDPPPAARDLHPGQVEAGPAPAASPTSTPPEPETTMADPRNIAHDKKVIEEKKHHNEPIAPENAAVAPQPGKKTPTVHEKPHEVPTSTHATSQHHKDKTTGHVEEPVEVQAEFNAKDNATDK